MTQRTRYGGMANTPFDVRPVWTVWVAHGRQPCYHQACDTLENIAWDGYIVFAKSTAAVLEKLARDKASYAPAMRATPIPTRPLAYEKHHEAKSRL